jgi:Mg2+ and Co2+ transporter CorA
MAKTFLLHSSVDALNHKINILQITSNYACSVSQTTMKDLLSSIREEVGVQETQLTLQDLRRLDYQMSPNEGTIILVHHHVVAFCLNPIRALITPKRLVFILHAGAENISSMVQNLMNAWDPESVSFEGHAYNSLFTAMAHIDNITYKSIVDRVDEAVGRLKNATWESLDQLRILKNDIMSFAKHLTNVRAALTELHKDEERLRLMNFSFIKHNSLSMLQGKSVSKFQKDNFSFLFDIYLVDYNDFSSNLEYCSSQIRHAEESEMLKVGVARIRMARVHTFLAVITCAIGFCAYITGIFGMNLDQTIWLQDIYGVFTGVVISTMLFLVLVVISVNVFLMRYGHIPD